MAVSDRDYFTESDEQIGQAVIARIDQGIIAGTFDEVWRGTPLTDVTPYGASEASVHRNDRTGAVGDVTRLVSVH